MNFAEARSLAVQGHRVRAIDMQPGAFVYYDFAGLRIDVNGNSSGWSPKPHDEQVEWEDVPIVVEPVKVYTPVIIVDVAGSKWGAKPDPAPANVGKWGAPKRDAWGRPTD